MSRKVGLHSITFELPIEMYWKIRQICVSRRLSMGAYIRSVLIDAIEEDYVQCSGSEGRSTGREGCEAGGGTAA